MKDYKLLLAGLTLLLLAIFIALLTWLWINNRKEIDPLPIMTNESDAATPKNDQDVTSTASSALSIRVADNLQVPIDDVIVSFESRYPHTQVLANYVSSNNLLNVSTNENSNDFSSVFDTDIIIANDSLSKERLAPLQAELKASQSKKNQNQTKNNTVSIDDSPDANNGEIDTAKGDNKEARTLNSFSYALKGEQSLQGVVLTDETVAVSFRNFLLSSAGQAILEKYDYYNINGYENSVNDLFQPTSQAKTATGENPVDVADALGNSEE